MEGWSNLVLPGAIERLVSTQEGAFQLRLWTPDVAAPPGGFPVVYVLDGDELFLLFAETMRRLSRFPERTGVAPAVIVGVSPAEGGAERNRRFQSFTFGPPAVASDAPTDVSWGGGATLLDFLTDAAPALLTERVPLDGSRKAVYGHSLGGYFALNAVIERPDAFAACGAISPSLWWDTERVLARIDRFERTRVFLAMGEREAGEQNPLRERRAMGPRLMQLEAALRPIIPQSDLAIHVFADEDHGSVASVAIARFLRFLG